MSKHCLLALMLVLAIQPLVAQSPRGSSTPEPAAPPRDEGELLKKLDALGAGDSAARQPMSIGVGDTKIGEVKRDETVAKKEKGPTEITAREAEADFKKTRQAVFRGGVVVKDPEFNVTCDRLTVVFRDKDERPANPPAAANGAAPGKRAPEKAGGLERAIAQADSGKKVVITQEKPEPDGSVTRYIGRGERADYNAKAGEIVLTGWPEVQQGINSIVATQEGTVITINRDGRMKTQGLHKTSIRDQGPETSPAR